MAQPAPTVAPRRSGWRLLGLVWLLLLLGVGGGAGVLAWLGPPAATGTAADGGATSQANAEPPPSPRASPRGEARPPSPAAATNAPPDLQSPAADLVPPEPTTFAGAAATPTSAPEPALLEPGPHGVLPRIGPEGRAAMRVYARPFDRADPRPRVGLVLGGIGLNQALAEEAIRRLPATTALAFSPYAPRLAALVEQARGRAMELLVALPLEPTNYPLDSPGDRVMLTGLPAHENLDRLEWALARLQGYVGAIGALGPLRGERFAALPDRLGALQETLRGRGLLYLDPRPGAPSPQRVWGRTVDVILDEPATRGEIEAKLGVLERLARERGTALGYAGEASPVLIDRIAAWAPLVEGRGVVLAPVTAMIRAPAEPQRAVAR